MSPARSSREVSKAIHLDLGSEESEQLRALSALLDAPGVERSFVVFVDEMKSWVGVAEMATELVPIGNDLALPARYFIERGDVRIDVHFVRGRPVYDLQLRNVPLSKLARLKLKPLIEEMSDRLVRTLVVRDPMADASDEERARREDLARRMAERGVTYAGTKQPGDLMPSLAPFALRPEVRRRFGSRITADDVQRAADLYREGDINAVAAGFGVEVRQAWRYVRRAQEAGLVERRRAPRRKD